jgi:hypothetical protein
LKHHTIQPNNEYYNTIRQSIPLHIFKDTLLDYHLPHSAIMNFNVKSTVIAFTLALTVSAAPLAPASGCPAGTVTAVSNFAGQSQVDTVCVQPNTCYADSAGNCAGQDGTYACAPNGWCCTGTDLRLTNQLNGNVCVSPDVGKANQETSSSNADRASNKE